MCCPRDCVPRHNGGTSGAPLKPLRVNSTLRAQSTLRGLRRAPKVPPLCRETSFFRTANVGTVCMSGLKCTVECIVVHSAAQNFLQYCRQRRNYILCLAFFLQDFQNFVPSQKKQLKNLSRSWNMENVQEFWGKKLFGTFVPKVFCSNFLFTRRARFSFLFNETYDCGDSLPFD